MLILVTGATGKVGRHVIDHLLREDVQVRALTRHPNTADLPDEVEVVRGDLQDSDAVHAALDGVDRLYLFPVEGTATHVMRIARELGVSRVVVLSSVSAAYGEGDLSGDRHRGVEVAVEESGIPWTHIRPGEFMSNLLDWAPTIVAEGVVRAPFADPESNAVHEADVADVAATALLNDGHYGHAYEVNGPQILTCAEQGQTIGDVIGREIQFIELSSAESRAQWIADGTDPELANWLLGDANHGDGEEGLDDPDVAEAEATATDITGIPARTFHQWVQDHIAAFTNTR